MAALDFPNSPTNGQTYTGPGGVVWQWDGTKWVNGSSAGVAVDIVANNIGRNLLHNPLFGVAQRGAGPFTTTGVYTLDRWLIEFASDSVSVARGAILDAGRAAIGDEAAEFSLGNTFTGNAAAGAFTTVIQWIEDVRRLGGKTVTVSFWAGAASGTPKLGVSLDQWFGSPGGGGSPQVNGVGQAVTLTTAWTRYSLTFTLASTAGKSISSSASDATGLKFWYSSGATNATRSGNIGVQSGAINIWGVQLEIGSVATPLEKPDPRYDLSNCQRFYQALKGYTHGGYAGQTTPAMWFAVPLPVTMHAAPTVIINQTGAAAGTTVSASGGTASVVLFYLTTSTAGQTIWASMDFTASADI